MTKVLGLGETTSGASVGSETDASTAECGEGETLTGGGATIADSGEAHGALVTSAPEGNTWIAKAIVVKTGVGPSLVAVTAYALCASHESTEP